MESQHAAHSFKWLLNESLRVCVVGRQNMNLQETEPLTKTGSSVSVWVLLPGPGAGGGNAEGKPFPAPTVSTTETFLPCVQSIGGLLPYLSSPT